MIRRQITWMILLFLFVNPYQLTAQGIPKTGDEFTGPFNSWLNAKTGFGAKGDGVTDDTRALQAAFDAAGKGTVNCTLYLPAGTYNISHILTLNNYINVAIIGADPANTKIKWRGAAQGTMLQVNGTAYSTISRITWDGTGVAAIAIDQSWDGKKPHFDTGNCYTDDVFLDVGYGIHGGSLRYGFAETSILRARFIRNTIAGVSLGNFNALDIWIRNSLFQDCATGVTNTFGAGNFRLYNNLFVNSTVSDISIGNTGEFSVRGNTSVNAKQFFFAGFTRNPAPSIIEGNRIIDPANTQAITVSNQGPFIFTNNLIRSKPTDVSGPVARFNNSNNSNTIITGNTFTTGQPVITDINSINYDNKIAPPSSLKPLISQPSRSAEPHINRKIFEIPAGANSAAIQAVINEAAKYSGFRPVVHFNYGSYAISATLFVPPGSDMQLVGDGYGQAHASLLTWVGSISGPILVITGPGKVTLRDLTFKGNNVNTNILILNADQKGSRIYLQNFNQSGGKTGMIANQLDHTLIFAYDTQFSGLQKAVSVIGGRLAAKGKPAEGRTVIYSGAESNNSVSHEVLNGGNLMVQDTWYEGGINSTFVKLSGKGIFTAAGDRIATPLRSDTPAIAIHNFTGVATFIANNLTGHFRLSGDCSRARVLLLGMLIENDPLIKDVTIHKGDVRTLYCRTRVSPPGAVKVGSYEAPNIGIYDKQWVSDMLAPANMQAPNINALPDGVSDIRIYHVMSINGAVGLDIEAGKDLMALKNK